MNYSLQQKDVYFYQNNSNGKKFSGIICSMNKKDLEVRVSHNDQQMIARSKVFEWCFGKINISNNITTLLSQFDTSFTQFLQSAKKYIDKISETIISNPKELLSVITNKLYLYWFENVFMNSKSLLMLDNCLEDKISGNTNQSEQRTVFITALDFIVLNSTPKISMPTELAEN